MTSEPPEPLFDILPGNSTQGSKWSLHPRILERFDSKQEAEDAAWRATEAYYWHMVRQRRPIVPVVVRVDAALPAKPEPQ